MTPRPNNLVTEASTYYIEVDDELVQFEAPNGHTGYRNAGHSRRYGLELDWQARLLAPPPFGVPLRSHGSHGSSVWAKLRGGPTAASRLDRIRAYAPCRRRSTAKPPTAIRMATASSTPSRETAGAGAIGSGEQMPRLPGPGLSQD